MLIVLFVIYSSSFAVTIQYKVTQNNWRWRNNDGSETKATWKAPQNTAVSYNATGDVVRLRMEMINTSTIKSNNCDRCSPSPYYTPMADSLQFSTTPKDSSSWKNIGLDSKMPFVMASADSYIKQDDTTSSQLEGSFFTFSKGEIMLSDSVLNTTSIPADSRSEYEWVIKSTKNLVANTTYYFRQWRVRMYNLETGKPIMATTYSTAYPSLITAAVLPIKLNSFTATYEGKKVRLEWSTATEENNDYFNIQRSTDGRTWKVIDKINGKGNSSVITNYTAIDYSPPYMNTIYYRLQQYDKDGGFAYSDVKAVKMFATEVIASVIPNPVKESIGFKLENISIKNVAASLTDISGRIMHKQAFENVQAGVINKLNLQHLPTPGIYMLKLEGDNLSKSIKVIVQ